MLVRAIRNHFDGVYRAAGDEFEYLGKKLHRHIEKVAPKPAEKQPEPEAEDFKVRDLKVKTATAEYAE